MQRCLSSAFLALRLAEKEMIFPPDINGFVPCSQRFIDVNIFILLTQCKFVSASALICIYLYTFVKLLHYVLKNVISFGNTLFCPFIYNMCEFACKNVTSIDTVISIAVLIRNNFPKRLLGHRFILCQNYIMFLLVL